MVLAVIGIAGGGHLSERVTEDAAVLKGAMSVGRDGSRGVSLASPPRSEKCPRVLAAVRFYSRRIADHRAKMGQAVRRGKGSVRSVRSSCPRYLVHILQRKARAWRLRVIEWLDQHTLRDTPFGEGNRAWPKAVREVQRVFPGTESWLLSCSAAEGGHGRWVGYAGVGYSTWLRDSDTVGGPLQFRFSTFTGMFRRGAEYAREKGYRLPTHLQDQTAAWRSALGQAIAGGWARYTGNDASHWSASWGRGC